MKGFPRRGSNPSTQAATVALRARLNEGLPQKGKQSDAGISAKVCPVLPQ